MAPLPATSPCTLDFNPSRRWVGLDVVRAVAILLVVCGHLVFKMPPNTWGAGFWFHTRQLALMGVDCFLALSGFLIGGMLLSEYRDTGSVAVVRFLARRAWRLLPIYFLVVLWGWQWYHCVHVVEEGEAITPARFGEMWPYFALIPNYYNFLTHHYGAAAVLQTWTLAVVIHFYVFFALLMAGVVALGRRIGASRAVRVIPWAVLATFVACFLIRWHNAPTDNYQYNPYRNYFPTHLRLDEPMWGVLLAYWAIYHRPTLDRVTSRLWWLFLVALVGVAFAISARPDESPQWLVVWGYTPAAVAGGLLVLTVWWVEQRMIERDARGEEPSRLRRAGAPVMRALAWVGIWSFAIYVTHQPGVEWLSVKLRDQIGRRLHMWNSPMLFTTAMVAYLSAAVTVGAIVHFLVERPILKLRACVVGPRRRPALARAGALAPATAVHI